MYNFQVLNDKTKFCSYKEQKPGNYVVGKILRFAPNKKNAKNTDVIVEVIESNIKTEKCTLVKGDKYTINGTTALQNVLNDNEVVAGGVIKVVFKGTETVKAGQWKGTQANSLEIGYVAPEGTVVPESKDSDAGLL